MHGIIEISVREHLLEVLCCPRCQGQLAVTTGACLRKEEIAEGSLACFGCGSSYPIQAGIPRLLPGGHSSAVQAAFTRQWRLRRSGRFEEPQWLYGFPHEERAAALACRLGGVHGGEPAWVLDAGCGTGELAAALAAYHPDLQIVALDFSDDLATMSSAPPNLHLVQGDVCRPPLRAGSCAAVYSLGVLHHTADTRAAFTAVARLVRPGGALSIWLYPHPAELAEMPHGEGRWMRLYYQLRDRVFLGLAHHLPPGVLLALLYLILLPVRVAPLPRHRPGLRRSRRSLHRALVFVLYDGLCPEHQHRHRRSEVAEWFREEGFQRLVAGPAKSPPHTLGSFTAWRREGQTQRAQGQPFIDQFVLE